ncbi:MAG: endonuclease/exonuclease/phosphatase family protein [Myxococcota bacterium]
MRILATVVVALAVVATAPAPPSTVRARVVSWNIQALSSGMDGVLATLRTLEPDVVALQEVDLRTLRSGVVDQPEALAKALGMKARFAAAMPYEGGEYGIALLSREELTDVEVLRLPRQLQEEPRIAMRAQTVIRGMPVTVINTHLAADWRVKDPPRLRRDQAHALRDWVRSPGLPTLLLGDFNCEPGSEPLGALGAVATRLSGDHKTHPTPEPTRAIDHVWHVKGAGEVRVLGSRAAMSSASDHLPLVVDLEIRRAASK